MRNLVRTLGGGELHGDADARPAFYPSLVTAKFYETWDFYTAILGFKTLGECDYYVQLGHASGVQFGLHRHEFDGVPAELVSSTDGRGFWLSIRVPDADAEYSRIVKLGIRPPTPVAELVEVGA
jgi:predicted enzyme related to lactoylglutathione lyase